MCHLHSSYYVLCSVLSTPTMGDTTLFTTFYREESEVGRKFIAFSHLYGQQVVESKFNCKFNLHQFQSSYIFFNMHWSQRVNLILILYISPLRYLLHSLFLLIYLLCPALVWTDSLLCYYNGFWIDFSYSSFHRCQLSIYCFFTQIYPFLSILLYW